MMDKVQVVVAPDPGDVMFDDDGTPMLAWSWHPEFGEGWSLYTMDSSDGVEDYFIGGRVEDVDWALGKAREWLARGGAVDT